MRSFISAPTSTMKHLFLLLTLVALVSCQKDGNTSSGHTARTVVVQPLGNFEASVAEDIVVAIRKVHPKVVLNAAIPLPPRSFYAPRNRYRADSIIRCLAGRAKDGSVVIGLAHTDISTTKKQRKGLGRDGPRLPSGRGLRGFGFPTAEAPPGKPALQGCAPRTGPHGRLTALPEKKLYHAGCRRKNTAAGRKGVLQQM